MRRVIAFGVAAAAIALAGCTTVPIDDGDLPADAPADVRTNRPIAVNDRPARPVAPTPHDTPAVSAPRIVSVIKPRYPDAATLPRPDLPHAYALFDDAVAVSEAIGDSPPDFGFRLINTDAWAWADDSGEMLIVEGEGADTIQYFFGARDDWPLFIRTGTYGYAFAEGRLIGTFHGNGAPVAERVFVDRSSDAARLVVRGRSLYHAATDRRWDRDTAQRWTSIQPAYGGWVTSWVTPPLWSGDYGRYRQRPESRERRERRRLTREQRRERAARFARWRNSGGVGAPPDGNDATAGTTPPRGPGNPSTPPRPPRPPRNGPPVDGGALVPAPGDITPPDPVRPEPAVQIPAPEPGAAAPRLRREAPGWLGYPNDQPQTAEPDVASDDRPGRRAGSADRPALRRDRRPITATPNDPAEGAAAVSGSPQTGAAAALGAAAATATAERLAAELMEAANAQRAEEERAATARAAQEQAAAQRAAETAASERDAAAAANRAAAERAAQEQAAAASRAAAERAAATRAVAEEHAQIRPADDGTADRGPD